MVAFNSEEVLEVQHWTDTLFSFATTRNPNFRFTSGQFTMIGLESNGRPVMRAYSMASASHEERLEFFSIKVPNGPLTSQLQKIRPGDRILVSPKPTGTLVPDNLLPGRRILLLSTGTGLAPFAAVVKDLEAYERYEKIILVHGCRKISELTYGERMIEHLRSDDIFCGLTADKLLYYPTVTREPFHNRGRITDLLESGRLFEDQHELPLDIIGDRVMICGNPLMVEDLRRFFRERGFLEGSSNEPGHFVIEKAFAER